MGTKLPALWLFIVRRAGIPARHWHKLLHDSWLTPTGALRLRSAPSFFGGAFTLFFRK